jgi:heterodisulfide reductase subunit A2
MNNHKVVVIGGGIAGMEASAYLSSMGFSVALLEKDNQLGGHLLKWDRLFPTNRKAHDVLEFFKEGIEHKVEVVLNAEIIGVDRLEGEYRVKTRDGKVYEANAILISTGYEVFDAHRKEEYGYGIYDNVITSVDLEDWFSRNREFVNAQGKVPKRVGFVHCVGSRDEKVGNLYCSKICCVNAVKQSIEVKQKIPKADIFCFYMDMRMFGIHFEELYKEAQEKYGITFVRGRLSEASENMEGQLVLKVEDTLVGRPLKMSVDLLVLMVGFVPSQGTRKMGEILGLNFDSTGFLGILDEHTLPNETVMPGVFVAGTCTSPKSINDTITDARSAAAQITSYLKGHKIAARRPVNAE